MAASLSKITILRLQCSHHSSKTTLNHTITDHPSPPPLNAASWLHRRPARFPRFQHHHRKPNHSEPPTAPSSLQQLRLVRWYLQSIKSRPIATKSATAALIYTAADITSQTIVGGIEQRYELVRTLRMGGYGMVILGPSLHYWYNLMSAVFPKHDVLSTLKKIGLGQAVYGPAMTVVFFSVNAALQGENAGEIVARLRRDLVPTMMNGVMYWPVCDFVTFKFIPVHLQPLVVNSFSYLWTIYMTYMASLNKASGVQ
ncbi:PXMP2/4 family protein 4-like [Salvia hispanica]|uniref:PXMP2/4 family protein 4-like n=1 Tax=Salvia hispanica TaxID=49212 RepID=UPI002009135B|nr:PXMP2/4 family protein 4-like [Salvia hispanica]XP_047976920.1 PXMP2/4 family protein 4-like [Salvia hispanica]